MNYKVIPLIYAANEHFKNTIRFTAEFNDEADPDALRYAADCVQKRYPYFSVRLEKAGEELVLAENTLPFVISGDGEPLCLNSDESNYHLVALSRKGNSISVDISHFICDGNGVAPFVKTLVYYYAKKRYDVSGIDTRSIRLLTDSIEEEEYRYPFPGTPLPKEYTLPEKAKEYDPFRFDDELFDSSGSYAYNLQADMASLMKCAKSSDGSPVSFVSVMLFRSLMSLYPGNKKDIVFQVPHEYRKVLGCPLSHDCLARVFNTVLSPKDADRPLELLNTWVRGQIILGSDPSADIGAVNGMLQLDAYMHTLPLEGKKQAMQSMVGGSIREHTFGISYTGNISWGGLERYLRDVHVYAGENERHGSLSVEMFTMGDKFSICIMQPGRDPFFVEELIRTFADQGIECRPMSEEKCHLADFVLP